MFGKSQPGRPPLIDAAAALSTQALQEFVFDLTSGLTNERLSTPGDFLLCDDASTGYATAEFNIAHSPGPYVTLTSGKSVEGDFREIRLNAPAQAGRTLRLLVGIGWRIRGGANLQGQNKVMPRDNDRYRVFANESTPASGCAFQALVAAQYSQVVLKNPAASGATLYVSAVTVASPVAGVWQIRHTGIGAPTTFIQNATGKRGGLLATAEIWGHNSAVPIGNVAPFNITTASMAFLVPANTPFTYRFKEPVILLQNQYVNAVAPLAQDAYVTWEFDAALNSINGGYYD